MKCQAIQFIDTIRGEFFGTIKKKSQFHTDKRPGNPISPTFFGKKVTGLGSLAIEFPYAYTRTLVENALKGPYSCSKRAYSLILKN